MPRYDIVPERSTVWIDARSSVHPIHSAMEGLEGYVELALDASGTVDGATKPDARLSFPVSRLSSGNRLEDRELLKRIDARRYPTIEGVLREVRPGRDGTYRVTGDITFRGVTRAHEDEMTIGAVDERTVRLAGSARFDIREFGMEPPRILMLKVDPEVSVRVEIVAVRGE